MALRRFGLTSIGEAHHPVAAISGIFHSVVDALVGEHTDHHQAANADVAQQVVEAGRAEG